MSACTPEPESSAGITPPDYLSMAQGQVVLERDQLKVTLTPGVGGRIASVVFAGKERLMTAQGAANSNSWGNVLWTSPQSEWGWPPPAALDSEPYRTQLTEQGVTLVGDADPGLKVAASKSYSLGNTENTLVIDYQIRNTGEETVTLAPWEITRLPAEGLIFFPKGETPYTTGNFSGLPFAEADGISWYEYQRADLTAEHHKVMTDGEEGWLAYQSDDYLFVKVFENVPAELMAPGEGEIEFYANGAGTYIELEQQGYLTTLMPGESLSWEVLWVFATVPEDLVGEHGVLAQRARQLAGGALAQAD
ncbi:DUF4380 domain-containing protein [Gilvimarinus algae]|uniref:DUF4380 domain-containing protein n=1 Tax=Gilvimarinus algae TaxID=3058037 RepID=A0ABT8TNG9_9GAMM|nr:DUF4380 domain-containing protein [Gilvimarinus sp. SDUM040014]MDO3383952.1 DUF4380 domain-containing protein [Gilvimarinus sp. SDUM040014]